jgi:hypothetical protein
LALRQPREPIGDRLPLGSLPSLGRGLLADRTPCRFQAKLADALPGSGGRASPSAVHIALIDDGMPQSWWAMSLSDGTAAAQGHALAIVPPLRQDDLGRRAVGSGRLESLRHSAAQDAWYLRRFSQGVEVSREADAPAPAWVLVEHCQRDAPDESVSDRSGCLGPERGPCRLLADRLPDHVVQERRRTAWAEARTKGRKRSQESRDWLSFGWSIPPVPPQGWPPQGVGTVSRWRWQVAWMVQKGKSVWNRHVLQGTRPERSAGRLSGRLITMTMLAMRSSYASWYAADDLQRALRFPQVIKGLKRQDRWVNARPCGTCEALFRTLRRALPTLRCQPTRNRRTSRQLLDEYGPSMEDALAASSHGYRSNSVAGCKWGRPSCSA